MKIVFREPAQHMNKIEYGRMANDFEGVALTEGGTTEDIAADE